MVKWIAVLAWLAATQASAYGVLNVEAGKPITAKPQQVECFMGHCKGVVDVLHFGGIMEFYVTQTGVADDISLEVSAPFYSELAQALIDKYGKPSSSDMVDMQNSFGAKVKSHVLSWLASDGTTMVLNEYSSLSQSRLMIRTKQEPRKSAGI